MTDSKDDIKKIVLERLRVMPRTVKLNIGGNYGSYSRDQLIEAVEKDQPIGKLLIEMQMSYLRSFKERV